MGIHLDTIEDNAERGWEIEIEKYIQTAPTEKHSVNIFEICPKCLSHFFSREELQDHIFYEHRSEEILINSGNKLQTSKQNTVLIDYQILEKERVTYLENQFLLANEQRIDLDQLNRLIREKSEIYLHQYRKGIFGYLDALYFEKNSRLGGKSEASRRLESIYGYLQPFNDVLSQQIRMSIAFQFNWFKALRRASKNSTFYLAHIFFSNSFTTIESISLPVEERRRNNYGVYISENSEYLLQLIEIFFNGIINQAKLQNILQEISRIPNFSDSQNEKLNFILARIHRKLNNTVEARNQYRKLIYNTILPSEIESEVQEYVRRS